MGDGPEHMEDQFASGRRRVDLLLKAQQRHALGAQLLDRSEKLGELASEPIEAHHGQRVALAGVGEKFDEAGTIHALAGHDVGEHLNGTGFLQASSSRLNFIGCLPVHRAAVFDRALLSSSTQFGRHPSDDLMGHPMSFRFLICSSLSVRHYYVNLAEKISS